MNIVNFIIAMEMQVLPSKLKADASIQSSILDLVIAQWHIVPSILPDGFYLGIVLR